MDWFELITTRGRWLRNVEAEFRCGEFRISWVSLDPGEDVAILIDRAQNLAYLNRPLDECQILAAQHQYVLALPESKGLIARVKRFLISIALNH